MRSLQQFWSARRIGDDRVTLVRLGPLRLWLARAEQEWAFAFEHGEPTDIMDIAQVPGDVVPSELNWTNMLFREAPKEFSLRASVPDRPVVVKPEHPVLLPEGESGTFYVAMPVFIEIILHSGRKELVLGSVPSRKMSDTWFGTKAEGSLCYSLPNAAEMDRERLLILPHQIICPLEIKNQSDEVLMFEKLCLRPQFVSLFSGNTHLWSSMVQINHEGSFSGTDMRYVSGQPAFEQGLVEVSKPRKKVEKSLHRFTFGSSFSKDIIFGK